MLSSLLSKPTLTPHGPAVHPLFDGGSSDFVKPEKSALIWASYPCSAAVFSI
jgi:hypothetical protein